MKILMVNKFFYLKGGSEGVFFDEAELLKNKAHEVAFFSMNDERNFPTGYSKYFVTNIDYQNTKKFQGKIKGALDILYSLEARKKMSSLLCEDKIDIAHLHNIHHQISPSIIEELKKHKIPIVMSLHDYKMVCPSYSMFADGKTCERCKNGKYYRCFLKKCTKNSFLKSALNVVEMYLHHKLLNIYDLVDVFISPSKFLKEKLKEMGFKGEVICLPNFINLEDFEPSYDYKERSIIYFGRLSEEKGLFTLVEGVKGIDIKLKIIGDGPLEKELESKVKEDRLDNIFFTGYKKREELKEKIRKSMFMVLPSEWYENNPRTVIEAFALGKPVIGARIGGIPELVQDGITGLTFEPGNVEDLRDKIKYLMSNPEKISEMGRNARKFVEKELNSERHYKQLIEIYQLAMEKHK